jgi:PKD repeat protein
MDYSDDQCMSMFTEGQKGIMDATLASFRFNISSEANLAATGTRDEDIANPVVCNPVAEFCDNRRLICAGSTINFEDATFNANSYTRSWNFEGGSPATSSSVSPTVTYEAVGTYDVSLTSTSSAGQNTKTKSDHIIVSPDAAQYGQGPFEENFENANTMNDFVIFNSDGSNAKWEYTTQGGFGSVRSVRMRNYVNTATESDDLVTPSYNVSSVSSPSLLFRVACAERGGEPTDQLKVYFSSNCGQTWGSPRIINFPDFNTAGLYTNEFVPTSNSQWKTFAFSMSSLATQENVRIRFEYVAGTGDGANNLYLDDINIGTALGVNDLGYDLGLSVFPNPTNDQTNLVFETVKPSSVSIRVFDILGQEVTPVFSGNVGSGAQNFTVNMSNLSAGLYTIRLDVDGESVYRKVIKK